MATKYINADTGNDTTGDGSSGLPWATLGKAISSSAIGDTIFCQNSVATYLFDTRTLNNRSLIGQSASGVVFDGGGQSAIWTAMVGATIKSLTIQNLVMADRKPVIDMPNNGVNTLSIQGCIFRNLTFGDFGASYAQSGVIGTSDGTYPCTVTLNVADCLFYNLKKIAGAAQAAVISFRAWDYVGVSGKLNITNVTIHLSNVDTARLTGVFMVRRGSGGVVDIVMKNSIVKNSQGTAVYWDVGGTVSSSTVSHSDLFGITNTPAGTGVITSDPLFIDAANDDFRLRPSSPCIDTGTLL